VQVGADTIDLGTNFLRGLAATSHVDGTLGTSTLDHVSGPANVGGNRTVTITPAANQIGTATVTVTVSDGVLTASEPITINVTATPSQQWRLQYFGIADDTGNAADLFDSDNDGFVNLLERALGGNPTTTTSALIQAGVVNNKLTITFTRSTANTDLTLTVQGADAPGGPWTDLARSTAGAAFDVITPGATVSESGAGATRTVQVGDLYISSDPAHPRRFMRVQAQRIF
jgi:hypothetical protein